MRHAAIALLVLGVAARVASQQPRPLKFDVSSIKVNRSGDNSMFVNILPGGGFIARNATLRELVQAAYQFEFQLFQIVGGDGWIDRDRFNVDAKADGTFSPAETSVMVQAMLADRFRVVSRREARQLPVFVLTSLPGRRPQQFRPAAGGCVPAPLGRGDPSAVDADARPRCGIHFDSGRDNALKMIGVGVTLEQLAGRLQFYTQRVVIDTTRLGGAFDFELEFVPDRRRPGASDAGSPPPADAGLSLATALREQLGLRLDSERGPVNVLVVDHAERPTEN